MQEKTTSQENSNPASQTSDSKYVNLMTDYGFNAIFKTEELAINFLNDVLEKEPRIQKIKYLDKDITGEDKYPRNGVADILCEDEHNREFIIQIQRIKKEFFMDMSVFYASARIQDNAPKDTKAREAWNFEQRPIIYICLMDFELPGSKPNKFKHVAQICDIEENKVLYSKLTFIFLELSKFGR